MMRFGTLWSGIEAPVAAWSPLGWEHCFSAEVDPFCCALLAEKYPEVRNYGDVTRIDGRGLPAVDVLIFGSPCQSFSVAGRRAGLDDPRGIVAFECLRVANGLRPRWLVFENVPGLLSSNQGRDFAAILGAMAECGYGFAYRVLDAQHFGVPQRRRRVFVVGYLGDWRPPAAVLFEPESLFGHPAAGGEAGEDVAGCLGASVDRGSGGGGTRNDFDSMTCVAHTLRGRHDSSEDGTGRGTPLVYGITGQHTAERDLCPTIQQPSCSGGGRPPAVMAFTERTRKDGRNLECQADMAYALTNPGSGGRTHSRLLMQGTAVRRLTPRECERLQGFPDDYTAITYRGKPAADGPRYRALGNSMAVPVVRWIGERIAKVANR